VVAMIVIKRRKKEERSPEIIVEPAEGPAKPT